MKLYLLSYTPGYSADFLASLIHKDKKFYQIEDVERSSDNRFLFPNFPKTFHSKMTDNISKLELKDDLAYLQETYNKNLCINVHMFANIQGPYEKKVKVYASSETSRRISYAMWWYKSHIENEVPNAERLEFIMSNSDVPEHLKTNFNKWKYLAWFKFKQPNMSLLDYINAMYKLNSEPGSMPAPFSGFDNLDLDKLIYTDNIDTSEINRLFDVTIDKDMLEQYRDKNYRILKDIGVDPNSNMFFDQLHKYLLESMKNADINLYEAKV